MWTRAQLKEKAKAAFNQNYWKVVLVCLILILLGTSGEIDIEFRNNVNEQIEASGQDNWDVYSNFKYGYGMPDADWLFSTGLALGMAVLFVVVFILVFALALAFAAFIGNPLDLGARNFLLKNLNEKAEVKEVAYAFDSNYKNIVHVLFFRDLYIILWSLLFIIPGIVKSYEYFMIPYLLTENPNLSKEEAFALSKQMMQGQKWNTFVLNLSFIGWDILSAITLGVLNIFYVAPYRNLTFAALFEELNAAHGYPARYVHRNYEQPNIYTQQVMKENVVPPHNTRDEI